MTRRSVLLVAMLAGCAGDATKQVDPPNEVTWTIDRASCSCREAGSQVELAAVRGSLAPGSEGSCVLFHGNASNDLQQQVMLREGEELSLAAMVTCTTTTKPDWPPDECGKLQEICASELALSPQDFEESNPSTIHDALCETPRDHIQKSCCNDAMESCVIPEGKECQDVLRNCVEQLGLNPDLRIEQSKVLYMLFDRMCQKGLSPLEPANTCCTTAETCSEPGPDEKKCRTCSATSSAKVDLGDGNVSLTLSEEETDSCAKPDWVGQIQQLSLCDQ